MSQTIALAPAPRATWGREVRDTLALALPLILTNITQVALGATDVIMMGWLGPEALAAGALSTNLNFAFVVFGMGLVTATAPMIAAELGRKRHSVRDVRRTVRQGLWWAILISIPFGLVLWHAEAILRLLGQEPALASEASAYNRTLLWSIAPFLGYIVLRNFVAALQRPTVALVVGIAGVVVNAFLVWGLMFGRFGFAPLGLPGAGIGTTLTCCFLFGGLAVAIGLDRRLRRYRLFGRFWRADWPRFSALWRLGAPIAVTMGLETTVFNASTFIMGLISPASIAAYSIAIQFASLTFMVPVGFGLAATVRVGRAYGAGDWHAVARAGWTAWALGQTYACFAAMVMLFAGRAVVGTYLALDEPANRPVISLALTFLVYAGLFQFFDCAQTITLSMLRGLHDTRVPLFFALLGYWVFGLPLGVLLAFHFGLAGEGIWIGLATGLAVVAVLATRRWIVRLRDGLPPLSA